MGEKGPGAFPHTHEEWKRTPISFSLRQSPLIKRQTVLRFGFAPAFLRVWRVGSEKWNWPDPALSLGAQTRTISTSACKRRRTRYQSTLRWACGAFKRRALFALDHNYYCLFNAISDRPIETAAPFILERGINRSIKHPANLLLLPAINKWKCALSTRHVLKFDPLWFNTIILI